MGINCGPVWKSFVVQYEDHLQSNSLRSNMGIICGKIWGIIRGPIWGLFAVQFRDHLWSNMGSFAVQYGDHLRSYMWIICGRDHLRAIWGSFFVRYHLRTPTTHCCNLWLLLVLFLLCLVKVKYHWPKSAKGETTVNLLCLIKSDLH